MLAASWPFIPTTLRPSAVRQLHDAGFPLGDLSIVGRDFQETEEPYGFVSRGDYIRGRGGDRGLVRGIVRAVHWSGIPDLARARPRRGRRADRGGVARGIEGAVAGTALGSLAGAFIGWGVPKDRAISYETQVKGGKFLVVVRSMPEVVARARSLLAPTGPEHIEVHEPPMS